MITMKHLTEAAERVWRKNGKPGPDSITVTDFVESGDIDTLYDEIRNDSYRTKPARTFKFKKDAGGYRTITVLCVRDRVVHCALSRAIGDIVDCSLSPKSFAYRNGRSCKSAVNELRNNSGDWIAVGDIESYFENIDIERMTKSVTSLAGEDVANLVERCILPLGERGLPQGSSLSPVLSNIYLNDFDFYAQELCPYIRYSDNFAFRSKGRDEALLALESARRELAKIGLKLNDKSHVLPTAGFTYLGEAL